MGFYWLKSKQIINNMSDEEDDYNSSDESSGNEYIDKKNGLIDGKPRVLTLEDNDDDEAAFHRPD